MNSREFILIALLFTITSWGFFAHKSITEVAIYRLPQGLVKFYKPFIPYLKEQSLVPDKRRYVVKTEEPKHYFDIDFYETYILDSLKRLPLDTIIKYISKDSVDAHGTLPYIIGLYTYLLTEAFKEEDQKKILKYSAELGHYVADAHVPLHLHSNYNGQKSDQVGLHSLWESQTVEKYYSTYDFMTRRAEYIPSIKDSVWLWINRTYQLNEAIFKDDSILRSATKQAIISSESELKTIKFTENYINKFHKKQGDIIENQLLLASEHIADIWYSCWVNAGQPDFIPNKAIELDKDSLSEKHLLESRHH